jgi:predicted dehydrogenase
MLAEYGDHLDAAFIVTPHAGHHDHARACLEAGLDVLLEKPMVMNADEARGLIETRDRTGRLLVVAFNGSLSPQIRTAARLLRSGELGELLSISYRRGKGKIFCFRPGHETYPIFYQPEVLRVVSNAVRWAAPVGGPQVRFGNVPDPMD